MVVNRFVASRCVRKGHFDGFLLGFTAVAWDAFVVLNSFWVESVSFTTLTRPSHQFMAVTCRNALRTSWYRIQFVNVA